MVTGQGAWPAEGPPQRRRGPARCRTRVLGIRLRPERRYLSFRPYTIQVDTADQAAKDLSWAIYQAAREVDQANAAELLTRTVGVLNNAGISCRFDLVWKKYREWVQ